MSGKKRKTMKEILELAARNRQRAWEIIRQTGVFEAWHSIGAEVHPVGSLNMGLLVKHRDIDLHVYTDRLIAAESFRAMGQLAEREGIRQLTFRNLAATDEACFEWHALYADAAGEEWTMDMIQILRGSRYDGYFERVAERIAAVLTDQTREAILRLKYETPDTEQIMGIEYYQAVLRDGVRSYDEFMEWRRRHSPAGIIEWMP